MRKSSLDNKKQEKKRGKAATKPDKTSDAEIQEPGGGAECTGAKAPRKSKEKKELGPDAPEELHKGAKKALRRAVKEEVKKDSKLIAQSLVTRTIQGDQRGAEMLLSLMERGNKEGKDGKKKRSGPSLIDLLESDPEWEGEEAGTTEAVGVGVGELAG